MPLDKKTLMQQVAKELHKPATKKYKRSKVFSNGINDIWAADLVDMSEWKNENNGYKFMLNIVDVFSRYAWSIPLQSKTGQEVKEALQSIIINNKIQTKKPHKLWVDQGTEFYNKIMEKYLKSLGIIIYSSHGEHKVSIVERFNRTLKTVMWKKFTELGTRNWIDMLPHLVKAYNNRVHSSLYGYTPNQAYHLTRSKEADLWKLQYGTDILLKKDIKPLFKIGDTVRISRGKGIFEKGYLPNWSTELFKIIGITYDDPIKYEIEDYYKEKIKGSFYEKELQKVKYPDIWLIDKTLKERTLNGKKEYFVSWVGQPSKMNSWVSEKDFIL